MTPLPEFPVLILDCQATGPASADGYLLEIGWVRTRAGDARHCSPAQAVAFCLRLPPDATIPRRVRQVTGLDEAAMGRGETAGRIWRRLLRSDPVRPIPTLIHYARFERPFLQRLHDARAPDRPFPLDIVCTHELVRRLLPELPRKGLRAVAGYFNYGVNEQRRCADHVAATARIWHHLQRLLAERAGVETWPDLRAWLSRTEVLPASRRYPMQREKMDRLTDRPGVYRMRRQNGELLYVGKAASLRRRVASYFRPKARHAEHILEMLTQARDIDVMETGSALEAALLESDEIKRLCPPYNRALRAEGKTLLHLTPDFKRRVAVPEPECTIGPLPGEQPAGFLSAMARLLRNPAAAGSLPPAGINASLGLFADRAPVHPVFQEGLGIFCRRHGGTLGGSAVSRAMMRIAARLWRDEKTADTAPDTDTEDEETLQAPADPQWTPETVADRLEGLLCQSGRLIRRSRWFLMLSASCMVWSSANGFRHRIVFQDGRMSSVGTLAPKAPVPFFTGRREPLARRRARLDLFAYEGMRVATTELRRLLAENRNPLLRLSNQVLLGPAQIERVLWWM
jgi:DNA polymerase-3 subunit epsilon